MNPVTCDSGSLVEMGTPPERSNDSVRHIPVLAKEVIDVLKPRPGGTFVDATFGGGGHGRLIAQRISPGGKLFCIDRDPSVRANTNALADEFPDAIVFIEGSYARLGRHLAAFEIDGVDGILFDLGFSSIQLEDPTRGFSFRQAGPLDMRFDPSRGVSASDLIANIGEQELAQLLFDYGEERHARRIARAVVRERSKSPITTTKQLATIVEQTVGGRRGHRIHPATRTFQALRITVNNELEELELGLRAGIDLLLAGARVAVISFHSLEDRVVKRIFAEEVKGCVCPPDQPICTCGRDPRLKIVDKVITPTAAEIVANPRARSARMRVAERLY